MTLYESELACYGTNTGCFPEAYLVILFQVSGRRLLISHSLLYIFISI